MMKLNNVTSLFGGCEQLARVAIIILKLSTVDREFFAGKMFRWLNFHMVLFS